MTINRYHNIWYCQALYAYNMLYYRVESEMTEYISHLDAIVNNRLPSSYTVKSTTGIWIINWITHTHTHTHFIIDHYNNYNHVWLLILLLTWLLTTCFNVIYLVVTLWCVMFSPFILFSEMKPFNLTKPKPRQVSTPEEVNVFWYYN